MRVIYNTVVKRRACANEYIFWQQRANFPRKKLKWYYDKKLPYLFFLHFESMIYQYQPCQSLGHDFDRLFELRILKTIARHYSIQKWPSSKES